MTFPTNRQPGITDMARGFWVLIVLSLTGTTRLDAQDVMITRINQGLALVNGPSAAFGDVDDDGDMDILVSGKTNVEFPIPITRVYIGLGEEERPTPGGGNPRWVRDFEERGGGVSPVWLGAATWFDPNRDGKLEFFVSGAANGTPPYEPQAAVYRSQGSQFARMSNEMTGLFGGSVDVGDYNNDGRDDILLTGSTDESYATLLYDGVGIGLFAPSSITLPAVSLGDGKFGDYDGDGDLDIFLIGDSGSGLVAKLLRNDGGSAFVEVPTAIEPLVFSSADWGDYDNDGDLDLLVVGARLSPLVAEAATLIYRNDGDGVFTETDSDLDGTYHGFARWGDMNNDGYLDIVQAGGGGVTQFTRVGQILVNRQNDQFVLGFNLPGLFMADGDLGDYDGDGDLDVVELGQGATSLSRNDYYVFGFALSVPEGRPLPPEALEAVVEGSDVTLSWGPGSDQQTPSSGLTYNIRVGTVPGSVDVVAPLAQPVNGKRKVSRMGNVQNNRRWVLRGLARGTYYWSVQSIDASFSGSDFAQDDSFVVE